VIYWLSREKGEGNKGKKRDVGPLLCSRENSLNKGHMEPWLQGEWELSMGKG